MRDGRMQHEPNRHFSQALGRKSRRNIAASLISLVVLSGCGPQLMDATDTGGSVTHANGIANQDAAFKLAEAHCEQIGMVAQITNGDPFAATMTFICKKSWALPQGNAPKP